MYGDPFRRIVNAKKKARQVNSIEKDERISEKFTPCPGEGGTYLTNYNPKTHLKFIRHFFLFF